LSPLHILQKRIPNITPPSLLGSLLT
jgi:hypothetical protein